MTGSHSAAAHFTRSNVQGTKSRIDLVPLVWSAALRVNRDISIQASIEYATFLPNLISSLYLVPGLGGVASTTTSQTEINADRVFFL